MTPVLNVEHLQGVAPIKHEVDTVWQQPMLAGRAPACSLVRIWFIRHGLSANELYFSHIKLANGTFSHVL